MLGRAAGRHLHALAHNRDPRPVQVGRRRGSIGSQRALGRTPRSLEEIDADPRRPGRPRHPPDAGRGTGRPHGRPPPALRRLLAGDPLAHAPRRPPRPRRSSPRREALLAAATPMIERQGLTLVGIAVANLQDDDAAPAHAAVRRRDGGALDAALDEVRERFGPTAVTRGRAARPRPGPDGAAPPRLIDARVVLAALSRAGRVVTLAPRRPATDEFTRPGRSPESGPRRPRRQDAMTDEPRPERRAAHERLSTGALSRWTRACATHPWRVVVSLAGHRRPPGRRRRDVRRRAARTSSRSPGRTRRRRPT